MRIKLEPEKTGLNLDMLPAHVAIIMDGNGRWAKKRSLPRTSGHRAGVEKVKEIVRSSSDIGIKYLTLYAFSTENWKRPKEEVGVIMSLLIEYLTKELQELFDEGVRFRFIGRREELSESVLAILDQATEKTKNNEGLTLCVAVNYGSRMELAQAADAAARDLLDGKIDRVDEQAVEEHLMTAGMPDPDLVIRTSGEERISNFLLWQMAYSELYFTDSYWPDFDTQELIKALFEYEHRKRRFGDIE